MALPYENLLSPARSNLRVMTAAGSATIEVFDVILGINKATGAATTVNINPSTISIGKVYTVKDMKGDAATNAITLTPSTGLINGGASLAISTNYGSVSFFSDGVNLFTVY